MALLALCLAPLLGAQPVDLQGEWKFKAGDDASWSSPGFDDSQWTAAAVPAPWGTPAAGGTVWYRKQITFSPGDDDETCLSLGPIADSVEVFVGGTRLGADGRALTKLYAIPPEALSESGNVSIALRVVRTGELASAWPRGGGPKPGPWLLGECGVVQTHVALSLARLRSVWVGTSWVVAGALLFLAVCLLQLSRRRPSEPEYRHFALVCGLAGLAFLFSASRAWGRFEDAAVPLRIALAFAMGAAALLGRFWTSFFRRPTPFLERVLPMAFAAGAILVFIPGALGVAVNVARVLGLVLLASLVLVASRASVSHGRVVWLGAVLTLLALPLEAAGAWLGVGGPGLEFLLPVLAPLPLTAAATTALVGRFAETMDSLDSTISELRSTNAAISRFIPHQFLGLLGKQSLTEIAPGDCAQLEMSVLFCDVRSFTSLSEKLTPAQVYELINSYLARIEPAVRAHGGFVDKYLGDGLMALFPGPASDAVRGALGMLAALQVHNHERAAQGLAPIRIGIGVNTGPLILGTVGSASHMACSVLADAVNLAARVEGLTKLYGASLLITGTTHDALGADAEAFGLRAVDRVRPVGKAAPVWLYEVTDSLAPESVALRNKTAATFRAGLEHFQAGRFAEAEVSFSACVAADPSDKAAALQAERSKRFVAAPPPAWDGVWTADSK